MSVDLAVNLVTEMFKIALLVSTPVILLIFIVGLIISIFEAATQINEMTITFVPKIVAAVIGLIIFGSWMTTELVDYTRQMLETIIQIIK
ncbi:flagellar biosynthetic protein FliQ [Sulfurihydrogenibium azorense Az-Fu1]|jgi:flagellar biosynthetic protein FliQ|uniref:Flagellar biosynthetic protein FliQ n=1 Tax=Sulfurihydrogenibium azorense (strain DSM 15241 / OCM 825 / Az-Fu1) TaxID=204536 RepID=C1DW35_SULAA|nr:flagellar biosynthesis protein FliQ [Sulfurihydrogenibium azorense]ACN98147.1 flagellar biosynthetic protein FliQ [Sulfurihydrogenibium azorense Az-Fu1]